MSLEFRQRSIGEYARMIWRHKLAILLPALAIGIAVSYVILKLPSMYESKSSLAINPPKISNIAVQSLSDEDVSQRLSAITPEVTSRNSLEPMITRFNLFERERASGTPMELVVDQMRSNIKIEPAKGGEKAGFISVAYKDRDPNKARDVTAELASKFIRKQEETQIDNSRATREFFDKQLSEVKAKLDEIDKQKLNFMMQNSDKLPSGAGGLIAQLQAISGDVKLARDKENSINVEISRMRDQIAFNVREQNNLREFAEKQQRDEAQHNANINRNPTYIEFKKKKSELEIQLQKLLTQFRPAHPDVVAKKQEIEQVSRDLVEVEKQVKIELDEAIAATQRGLEARLKGYDNERQRLENEIARQQQTLEQVRVYAEQRQAEAATVQAKLNGIPSAEVALGSFQQEYQTAKQSYDELLKKRNEAELLYARDENLKGAMIEIVDRANTPQAPVNASKRYSFMFLGFAGGFGLGLLIAFLLEFPTLLTINSVADAKHYTGLTVLAAVPELITDREEKWQRKLMMFKTVGGLAAAVVSVPLLIVALRATRVFELIIS